MAEMVVERHPLARTYIASLRTTADLRSFAAAPRGAMRKQLAVSAIDSAERASMDTLAPRLDALKAQGLLLSYERIPYTGTVLLRTPTSRSADAWQAVRSLPELGRIVRNRVSIEARPHPAAPQKPAIATPGNGDVAPWHAAQIGADKAWAAGARGQGVTIGFVDSGASPSHPAISHAYRGALANGARDNDYNFFDALGGQSDLHDAWGHGTNTSSVAVGSAPGIPVGVAPDAKFISARVFGGAQSDLATMLRGMSWMMAPTDSQGNNPDAAKAPDIVNMSFGGRDAGAMRYLDVLRGYEAAGIIPVAAAGNGGKRGPGSILSPAAFDQAIAVGFTDRNDVIDPRSAIGPAQTARGTTTRVKPDVVAPGTDVVGATIDGGYAPLSGSSMSSAVASGAIALLLSKFPTLSTEQIRQAITSTAKDLGEPGADTTHGHGRIDVWAALQAAERMATADAIKGR